MGKFFAYDWIIEEMASSGYFKVNRQGQIFTKVKWAARKYKEVPWYRCDREDGKGYRYVSYKGNRPKAHRLAFRLYHGYLPKGLEIDHKNSDGRDNRKSNLQVVSSKENSTLAYVRGENPSAKLTVAEVLEIRRRYDAYSRPPHGIYKELSDEYGVHQVNIRSICLRNTWKWVEEI